MDASSTTTQVPLGSQESTQNTIDILAIKATALFDALAIPSVLYTHEGAFIASNDAFRCTFPSSYDHLDRIAFISLFDSLLPSMNCNNRLVSQNLSHNVYLPENGQSYVLNWSTFLQSNQAQYTLLCIQNLPTPNKHYLPADHAISTDEMATTLAHEISQPLASITNYLNTATHLLDSLSEQPQRLQASIQHAKSQAKHAAEIIGHIREFAMLRQPKREVCQLKKLIEHAIELSQLDAQKFHIEITQDISVHLPAVLIDPTLIEQVLVNLIKNAIDAMQSSPATERVLVIRTFKNSDNALQIHIKDQGCGITIEQETQLFTPFYTTKKNGMGVGLAICRSIIERHCGRLYFERNVDKGASFIFTLPQLLNISTQLTE